jgi:hypothetical protein
MKRLLMIVLMISSIFVLSACINDPGPVDCASNPEHEDCVIIDECEENPLLPQCNIVYTFEDSYDMLDIDNQEQDDFATLTSLMNNLINNNQSLFEFSYVFDFENFYSAGVNSTNGLSREDLIGYTNPGNVLLSGIEVIHMSIPNEISNFAFNPTQDEYVEGEVVEATLYEDYLGKSSIYVNENSFQYTYEVEMIESPEIQVSLYQMTLVVDGDRLIYEVINLNDFEEDSFDYFYLIYDSEVGYVVKDIKYYNQSLNYYENTVDLNNNTAETKQINLGAYQQYSYSSFDFDEQSFVQKITTKSQIGTLYEISRYSYYNGLEEVVSLIESAEKVDGSFIPTDYQLSYNIAYLENWDIAYGNYLIANNEEVAYISSMDAYSISVPYKVTTLLFNQLPVESEFLSPYDGLAFSEISYTNIVSDFNVVSAMINPVYYDNNVITVEGIEYDVRTELVGLFTSDIPDIVSTHILDVMIVDVIYFTGDELLIDIIDCDLDPDNELCPDIE